MQVIIPGSGVSGSADIGDGLTLPGDVAFRQTFGISIEVRVIKNKSTVSAQLIDSRAATIAVKQFNDGPVRGGNDRRSQWRWNIDRVMSAPFGTRVRECVAQLIGPHTRHRNNQLGWRAGKFGGHFIGS